MTNEKKSKKIADGKNKNPNRSKLRGIFNVHKGEIPFGTQETRFPRVCSESKITASSGVLDPSQTNKEGLNWFYSETVKEHFFNPRNIFKTDQEAQEYGKTAGGIGMVGSPACGDMMKIWIKVKDGRIAECKWQTFGCASAIASTSVMSVMVTENGGMKLEDAMKIKPADIVKKLESLPARKIHCSVLGDQALKAAIKNYQEKNNFKNDSSQ